MKTLSERLTAMIRIAEEEHDKVKKEYDEFIVKYPYAITEAISKLCDISYREGVLNSCRFMLHMINDMEDSKWQGRS